MHRRRRGRGPDEPEPRRLHGARRHLRRTSARPPPTPARPSPSWSTCRARRSAWAASRTGRTTLAVGDVFTITTEDVPGTKEICSTTFKGLPEDVNAGDFLLIDDGKVALRATDVDDVKVVTEVIVGGTVSNNKGINLPGVAVNVPALSEKDEDDLRWGLQARRGPDRPVVRARRRGHQPRARDHGRGGPPGPGDRQDREAAGRGAPGGDHRRLRRHHGGPRRPRRGAAARGRCRSCRSAPSSWPAAGPSRSSSPPRCSSR